MLVKRFNGPFTPDLVGAVVVHGLCPKCYLPGAELRSVDTGADRLHVATCDRCAVEWQFDSTQFTQVRAADVLPSDVARLAAEIRSGIGSHRRFSCLRCRTKLPETYKILRSTEVECVACGFRVPLSESALVR
jgi:DNA-directed RNA polymerase subunit RPC12/RpoP